jgi:transcriptional antiterminator NusG
VIENQHNPSHVPDDAVDPHGVVSQPPAFAAGDAGRPDEPTQSIGEQHPVEEAAESEPAPAELAADAAQGTAGDEGALNEGVDIVEEEEIVEEEVEPRGPIEETPVVEEPPKMDWYILKVQSNREDSIRDSLQRRVKVAGLERFFGEIIVPTEMVSEFKGGKKRVVKRKLYPGYLVAHMEINEETWFLVRETPGIGDFTGSAGKPTPMLPHEVAKIVAKQEEKTDEAPKLKINFNVGDRVKINEGTFENFEGEVDTIDEASGRVTVMINIFGRSTPVELEYWQIESI